ncbi:MAG: replication initiator protein [Microviridae sp.]|nr:MAG: replication initiator protein [Microviridae sp.]
MRCTRPRTVGFKPDGKTICWSQKHASKEFATFQLPCGKCLSCRLEYSRQWAIRCMHEASLHENNSFITLTYDDAHLGDNRLIYSHFQTFIKDLRDKIFRDYIKQHFGEGFWSSLSPDQKKQFRKDHKNELDRLKISVFVTGEYGDKSQRMHWHALIFNWRPTDLVYKYSNDRGDKSYTSLTLTELWPHGNSELGQITFESAAYCARYAAKKLYHGRDQDHDLHPVSRKSSHSAIGKKFLEFYWRSIFSVGKIIHEGNTSPIPRYYEKWLAKHQPVYYQRYVTDKKSKIIQEAHARETQNIKLENEVNAERKKHNPFSKHQISRTKVAEIILDQKFNQNRKNLKL